MSRVREDILRLLDTGMSRAAVAQELRLAGPTVDYHADRKAVASAPALLINSRKPLTLVSARRASVTRGRVAQMLDAGLSRTEIASRIGVTVGTVSYHARRLGAEIDDRCSRRYDWAEIQRQYDSGLSMQECRALFGFSTQTWHAAVSRGAVHPRPAALPMAELFSAGTRRARGNLKRRLFAAGLKQPNCDACGIDRWRGTPLTLQLHHVNGDRFDNRVENLEVLCPNCHSLTDTYGGRGRAGPAAQPKG